MKLVQPIKAKEKIGSLRKILKAGPNGPRDEALFVLGINSALRVGDLLALRVGDVLDRGKLRERVVVKEQKTQRRHQIALNDPTRKVLEGYLKTRGPLSELGPGEALFPSHRDKDSPITRQRAHQILKEAAKELGLPDFGPHSLRKTFAYHVYRETGNNIALVQKLLNHDSPGVTLRYIGIEQADMDEACLNLRLY